MSSPQELSVSFRHSGIDYNINLVKDTKSDHAVKINGCTYAVLGDKEKLESACKILESISLESISNSEDLQKKLSLLYDISFPPTQKADEIGTKTLGTKQKYREWKNDEEANLPKIKEFLADIFWKNKGNPNILEGIRSYLGQERFAHAIASNDFQKFTSLFDDLSADEIWAIRNNENCQPLGNVKTEPYEITKEDLINLKHYLDDIGFSGVVSLSDAKGTYTITPTKQEPLENNSFSMNSISKIFTGTLALMIMSSDDFKEKMKLSPSVLDYLENEKKEVFDQLQKSTLLQTMNHDGGFGDYLREYEKAITNALENKEEFPVISAPEDFLKFAETITYPLDSGRYSNLGILFVGLAIQHKCEDKPYDQLLDELILTPANMKVSKSKPEGGKFNENDPCKGLVSGGPSGGYWTTSQELIKLGTWLAKQCRPTTEGDKSEFLSKLELYGSEFYVPEDQEIRHNGCSAAGSSFFSSFLQSRVTIAVLSDQSDFMANRIHYTIREKLIEQKD